MLEFWKADISQRVDYAVTAMEMVSWMTVKLNNPEIIAGRRSLIFGVEYIQASNTHDGRRLTGLRKAFHGWAPEVDGTPWQVTGMRIQSITTENRVATHQILIAVAPVSLATLALDKC